MTAVLPPRTNQAHIVAWVAGYLAAAETVERDSYDAGYRQALLDVCSRIVEVEHLNRHLWDEARVIGLRRAETRRAEMETSAGEMYARDGRTEYRGGEVDFETGRVVRRLRGAA